MKIAGITAEYNPLHNGHVYHIEETRRRTDCDVLVVAMSGNFVQRGEPAILDKWQRAEHALKAGADLVVEIPTLFCLGNASQYASASVNILESLGCSVISFGSGSGDIDTLSEVAGVLADNQESISSHISEMIKKGISYPAARSVAYRALRTGAVIEEKLGKELAVLSESNDILALEYLANMRCAKPLVIKRQGAYHEEGGAEKTGFRSAEYIRNMLLADGVSSALLKENVPEYVSDAFFNCQAVFPDSCFDILKYAILSTDAEVIDECPSGGEGLGSLLMKAVKEADSYNDLILTVKSKRYTYTRISRLCMQVLLGITRGKYGFDRPGYIRVLGHNEKGRELLSEKRKASKDADNARCTIPLITNINKEAEKLERNALEQLGLDIHASEIYSLISGDDAPEHVEQRRLPAMM